MRSKQGGRDKTGSGPGPVRSGNSLREKDRMRRKQLFTRLVCIVLVPALTLAVLWEWATRPMPRPAREIRLAVAAHSGVIGVGRVLQQDGVVRSAYAFAITAKLGGKASSLKAGHYKFGGDLGLDQVIDRLTEGPNDLAANRTRVTIPEGFTVDQIGELLADKGVMDTGQFQKFVTDPSAISGLTVDFPLPDSCTSLEGYLFPDTYAFLPHSSPTQIVNEMLVNFSKRFYRPYQREIDAAPGGLAALVNKASLIEREAREEADRPRIAGVLNNRLKKGMKLQIDATVLYLREHKTRIMDVDLKRDSPYNTYLHTGLPAGPIANPGISSLLAALHPENNDYLYYVARPSGFHIFTDTFAEHEAAVKRAREEWKGWKPSARTGSGHTAGGAN